MQQFEQPPNIYSLKIRSDDVEETENVEIIKETLKFMTDSKRLN